ncbi:MAG: hypothetical protein ACOY46_00395 [Bacillota bacterium]
MAEDLRDLGELVELIKHHIKDCKKKDDEKCKAKCKNVNQNGAGNQNNVKIEDD